MKTECVLSETPPPFDSQEWVSLKDPDGHLFGRYHPQTQTISITRRLHGDRVTMNFPLDRYHIKKTDII